MTDAISSAVAEPMAVCSPFSSTIFEESLAICLAVGGNFVTLHLLHRLQSLSA